MRETIFGVVSPGIQMKFVLDARARQLVIEFGGALAKAVFVLLAAIEVDGLTLNLGAVFTNQIKRIIGAPVRNLDGVAEHRSKQVSQRACVFQMLVDLRRRFGDQRRALGAYRAKQVRAGECEAQRAITTHGKACDCARVSISKRTEMALDVRNEFAQKKVAIAVAPVGRVDEEAALSFGNRNQKLADLVFLSQILNQSPSPGAHEHLLVFAEPVQEIKRRIFFVAMAFVARRQEHAITHRPIEDAASQSATIDAALRSRERRECDDGSGQRQADASESRQDICPWSK